MFPAGRIRRLALVAAVTTLALMYLWVWGDGNVFGVNIHRTGTSSTPVQRPPDNGIIRSDYLWKTVPINYEYTDFRPLPTSPAQSLPKVQATFPEESEPARKTRQKRQETVKATFLKSWNAYKEHAWMSDELEPNSGGHRDPFGGWAASLVDALDTLWIMDLKDEFEEAVDAVRDIDFKHTDLAQLNVFETTIRYLGGFISAFELSNDERLLRKAVEVGEMIYKAFDTPNHMPVLRWDPHKAIKGEAQVASEATLSAEIGSLCMELTRLSQLTDDPKWFDATDRITELFAAQQDTTDLPGLWPLAVNPRQSTFNVGSTFTLGAMADSLYEYLPKMTALTSGRLPAYQTMYEKAMDTASKHNLFRPMTPGNEDILISGAVEVDEDDGSIKLEPQGQHLVCFVGGMLALGGKLFNRPQDVELATKLTEGCIYTYKAFPHGIMPETFYMMPCESQTDCAWDEKRWKDHLLESHGQDQESGVQAIIERDRLPKGFTKIPDRRYILRPEAIESVFILYRVTGRKDLLESAWDMYTAIDKATSTELANSAVWDVTNPGIHPGHTNSMESFWMGETLKYFYLIFSDPDLINLDEYVFNTEAHPFKRM